MKTAMKLLVAGILPLFVSCGVMSGIDTSFDTSDSTNSSSNSGTTTAKVAAVTRNTGTFGGLMINNKGEMLLPIVDRNLSGDATALSGVVWSDATGGSVTVFFDNNGLPTQTVWGDFTFLFSNWDVSAGTVNIAKVFIPNGYIELFKDVPVDTQKLAPFKTAKSSHTTKSTCFPACETDTKNLSELLKFSALGISVGACGVATTVSLGAMALPCAGVIVTTASVLTSNEDWLDNTEQTSGILTTIDAFKCTLGSAESCISAALEMSSKTLEGIDKMFAAEESGLINNANMLLTAPTISNGIAQQGTGLLTCTSAYQCTPDAYMPCYPDGVKQCKADCTWGACPVKATTVSTGGSTSGSSGSGKDCTCYCDNGSVCTSSSQCPADNSFPGISIPGVCGCPVDCK